MNQNETTLNSFPDLAVPKSKNLALLTASSYKIVKPHWQFYKSKFAKDTRRSVGEGRLLKCDDFDYDRLMFGSIIPSEKPSVVDSKYLIDYEVKRDHPYHIATQEVAEDLGNATAFTVYWMPTYGFCSLLVMLFHCMVSRDARAAFDYSAIFSLLREFFETDADEISAQLGLLKTAAQKVCQMYSFPDVFTPSKVAGKDGVWSLTCDVSTVTKRFRDYGIPIASKGTPGVVFCRYGNVLHCGYKTYWKPASDAKKASCKCFLNVKLPQGLTNSMVDYLNICRRIYGGSSACYSPVELKYWFDVNHVSYNIYEFNGQVNKELFSNNKYQTNALVNLLYSPCWTDYVVSVPTIKTIPSSQSDFSDVLRKAVFPSDGMFRLFQMPKTEICRINGEKYYCKGIDQLVHYKIPTDSYYVLPRRSDNQFVYNRVNYFILDREVIDGLTVCTCSAQSVADLATYRDKLGTVFEVENRRDPSVEALHTLREWMYQSDKFDLICTNFAGACNAAYLYCSTAKHNVSIDWISAELLKFSHETSKLREDFKYASSGNFTKQRLYNWFWRYINTQYVQPIRYLCKLFGYEVGGGNSMHYLCAVWLLIGFAGIGLSYANFFWLSAELSLQGVALIFEFLVCVRSIIVNGDFDLNPCTLRIYNMAFYPASQFFWCVVCILAHVFTSFGVYFGYTLAVDVGSLPPNTLRKELSRDKISELLSSVDYLTPSLSHLSFYWCKVKVSLYELYRKLPLKAKPFKYESLSKTVPLEYVKCLHKIAPASVVGGLWAFLIRASSPLAVPEYDHIRMMQNYSHIKVLADELIFYIKNNPYISFVDYVKSVLRRKRAAYIEGMRKFQAKPYIPNDMSLIVKPDEKQHHKGADDWDAVDCSKYKSRNIYNPKEQVKGVCGWFMQIIMNALKTSSSFKNNFVSGMTPSKISEVVTNAYYKCANPVFVSWDGSRHDSLQHLYFLEDVDNALLRDVVPVVGRMVGFTSLQIQAVIDNLTALHTDVTMSVKQPGCSNQSKLNVILKAKVHGTVFSGHPSRTTFGNTMRILMLSHKISCELGLVWNKDIFHFQAGDDTMMIIDSAHVARYQYAIEKAYKQYGLLMQDFKIGQTCEFLSRNGFMERGKFWLERFPDRVSQTGLFSTKVCQADMAAFDKAITSQISAWGSKMTGVSALVRWRRAQEVVVSHKSKARVTRALEDNWNILNGDSDVIPPNLVGSHRDYIYLDACMGNPIGLWIKDR
jgi:hypothetical protein